MLSVEKLLAVTLYRCSECETVATDKAWHEAWHGERLRRMGDRELVAEEEWSTEPTSHYGLDDRMVCPRPAGACTPTMRPARSTNSKAAPSPLANAAPTPSARTRRAGRSRPRRRTYPTASRTKRGMTTFAVRTIRAIELVKA